LSLRELRPETPTYTSKEKEKEEKKKEKTTFMPVASKEREKIKTHLRKWAGPHWTNWEQLEVRTQYPGLVGSYTPTPLTRPELIMRLLCTQIVAH
jgi:hypothetical protein